MDARLVDEASEWLDQTWDALSAEPYYERDEFAFLRRMESDIRQYTPELQRAIKLALGRWLLGEDTAKIVFGLLLVERLGATEVLPDVEKLYADALAGRSPLRRDWLYLVKKPRDHLRRAMKAITPRRDPRQSRLARVAQEVLLARWTKSNEGVHMVGSLAQNWRAVMIRGAAAVIFGLLVLFWPGLTLLILLDIFAVFVLVEGVVALVSGLRQAPGGRSRGLIALGIIGIIAGIVTFVWPNITGLVLLLVIGIWAIAVGVTQIYAGVQLRRQMPNEWLLILTGVIALFFGLIVVIAPSTGALAFAFLIGFFALIYGVLQLALAFRLRGIAERGGAA